MPSFANSHAIRTRIRTPHINSHASLSLSLREARNAKSAQQRGESKLNNALDAITPTDCVGCGAPLGPHNIDGCDR